MQGRQWGELPCVYGRHVGNSSNERDLKLGGEITSAIRNKFELRRGQLQVLGGGNYAVRKDTTFDFGIVAGHFAASPGLGVLVGVSRVWPR
jgi:hypothetical protein